MKFASLFTGGDLAGVGARAAGFTPIWGVEYDPDIAAIAELNGTPIIVSKVEDVDFSVLESPDWLHMSPPCINASIAKTDAGEAPEDIEMAQGCIRAIRHFKSPFVSLENVWGYRNFESFQLIYATLMELGYQIRFWHLCAADYGTIFLCPIHDVVCAGRFLESAIVRDIAVGDATMPRAVPIHPLVWDAVALLGKAIQRVSAASATWPKSQNLSSNSERKTQHGRVGELLMGVATSISKSTGNISENIELWLNAFWEDLSLEKKLSTTKTKILPIIQQTILRSIAATPTISQGIGLGNHTEGCGLCRNLGIPQTRKRLILVARSDGQVPKRPEPSHRQSGNADQESFFGVVRAQWTGWYEAIEDLIPSLPESEFAEWQLKRLQGSIVVGGEFDGSQNVYQEDGNQVREADDAAMTITQNERPKAFLVHNNDQRTMPTREGDEPSFTVMAGGNNSYDPGIKPKAFIASCHQSEGKELTIPIREADEPSVSVGCHSPGHHKAFLMPGGNSSSAEPREPREPREPSMTIGDTERVGNIPRAFLVDRINYNSATVRESSEPAFTESVYDSQHQAPQAFLVDGQESSSKSGLQICQAKDPSPTATATATQHPMRAWLSQGKVVALSIRALARLQSVPDSYMLPAKNSLACRIIGNGVPPLLMKAVIKAQMGK